MNKKFIINPTNEFHVLRHFQYVDKYYKKTLIGQLYWYYDYEQRKFLQAKISATDIENALETISTKFKKNIAGIENPKSLLTLIKHTFQELILNKKINWITYPEYKVASFNFDYLFSVGQMNCVNIDNISKKKKTQIKHVFRSKCAGENKVLVNIVSGVELFSTKTIHVEIVETKQLPFYIITAFPDCPLTDNISEEKLVFVM